MRSQTQLCSARTFFAAVTNAALFSAWSMRLVNCGSRLVAKASRCPSCRCNEALDSSNDSCAPWPSGNVSSCRSTSASSCCRRSVAAAASPQPTNSLAKYSEHSMYLHNVCTAHTLAASLRACCSVSGPCPEWMLRTLPAGSLQAARTRPHQRTQALHVPATPVKLCFQAQLCDVTPSVLSTVVPSAAAVHVCATVRLSSPIKPHTSHEPCPGLPACL